MNMIELKGMRDLHEREFSRLSSIQIKCGTCEHWKNQRCEKYGMVPPAEVKVEGCESWEFDWVPF